MKKRRLAGVSTAWLLLATAGGAALTPASAQDPPEAVAVFANLEGCPVTVGNNSSITGQVVAHGDLRLGNAARVKGPVHTEQDLTVGNGSAHRGPGAVTYVSDHVLGTATSTWTPLHVAPRAPMRGPSLPGLADPSEGAVEHHHPGNWTVKNGATLKDGVHRVDGNVVLGNQVRGQVTIIANGTITTGNNASLGAYRKGMSLVSEASTGCSPAITIGNNSTVATIHAPTGAVKTGNRATLDAVVAAGFTTGNDAVVKGRALPAPQPDPDENKDPDHNEDETGNQNPDPDEGEDPGENEGAEDSAVEVRVPRGSITRVQGPDGFTDMVITSVAPALNGVTWQTEGALAVAVGMNAAEGESAVTLSGTGCSVNGCDQPWSLPVALTVTGIEADDDVVLEEFPSPSADRAAAARVLGDHVAVMSDEVTIVIKDPAGGRAVADAVAASVEAVVAGGHQDVGAFLLRWDTAQEIQARLDQLIADDRVASVEGSFLTNVTTTNASNVPGYSDEDAYGDGDRWHLDLINAPAAWQKKATGSRVRVGILELDLVENHKDLPSVKYFSAAGQGHDKDHASHVAGLACAKDDGKGVIGVAHGCDLVSASIDSPYRVSPFSASATMNESGSKWITVYEPDQLDGLKRLINSGARVVNASFGQDIGCTAIQMTIKATESTPAYESPACDVNHLSAYYDYFDEWSRGGTSTFRATMASASNTLLVVSAGNRGVPSSTNLWGTHAGRYAIPNVLTVASVDENARLSYFSNFGREVRIAAPGGFQTDGDTVQYAKAIMSTISNHQHGYKQGTSMAAPLVAGTAALVAQVNPEWTGAQIADRLIESSSRAVTSRNDRTADFLKRGHQYNYSGSIPLLDAAAAVGKSPVIMHTIEGAGGSWATNGDGRWIVYQGSYGGKNGTFVWDRETGTPQLVSSDEWGQVGISADGRWITHTAAVSSLVEGHIKITDVFVWDRETNTSRQVSVTSDGVRANDHSFGPSISADGRWVAFISHASNLVEGDTNGEADVFLWDRDTGQQRRVSFANDGIQPDSPRTREIEISADGRWVAYASNASNLVDGDTNNASDVFQWDRMTGDTRRVSVASDGTQANDHSEGAAISAGGRWMAYTSNASNLVDGDTNGVSDIFYWDRVTGDTQRISVASDGTQGARGAGGAAISADGRWVTYVGYESEGVSGETDNPFPVVFVWDRKTRETQQVSFATRSDAVWSSEPWISADGQWITYRSQKSNESGDVLVSTNPLWVG